MKNQAKDQARLRLARMEGQVRGLLNMIENERDSIDILTQVAALRAALEGFGSLVLTEHMEELVGGSATESERADRMKEALARFIK